MSTGSFLICIVAKSLYVPALMLTRREQLLVTFVIAAFLAGLAVKHFRGQVAPPSPSTPAITR